MYHTLMSLLFYSGFVVNVGDVPIAISPWSIAMVAGFALWGTLYIKKRAPRRSWQKYVWGGIAASSCVILSLGVHELSHAFVAKLMGVNITGAGITGFGAYVSLGVSNVQELGPMRWALISIAGPISNFAIAFLAMIPVRLFGESVPENAFQFIALNNVLLAKFNLLPAIILDGGKVVLSLVWLVTGSFTAGYYLVIATTVLSAIWWMGARSLVRKGKKIEDKLESM